MDIQIKAYIRRITIWFNRLSSRESSLILFASLALLAYGLYSAVEMIGEDIEDTKRLVTVRKQNLDELSQVASRYKTLKTRLTRLQESFSKSEMTFEEVTSQIDAIVRKSIGSDDYDLKKGRTPTQIGFEYEKQQFTLKVNSLTLEDVVRLLYNLEQGESPLILGKVDLRKLPRKQEFTTSLEIFSVRKSKA
jgi:septal ring factor EnvC (AmiA/AmiB activator)